MKVFKPKNSILSWQNFVIFCAIAFVLFILLYRLGNLVGGISSTELHDTNFALGWHGIFASTLYLPLQVIRSLAYWLFTTHGAVLDRLPDVFFGFLTIFSFGWLLKLWHDLRTAILTTLMFICSAWFLHTARIASFDILYLWLLPTLLLSRVLLHRHINKAIVFYGCLVIWATMLFIPGAVWLIGVNIYLQRQDIKAAWNNLSNKWQKPLVIFILLIPIPLLAIVFTNSSLALAWLGLPPGFAGIINQLKLFALVPFHLLIQGPQASELWIGRAPIFNIFELAMALFGIYYYATHLDASRSRLLAIMGGISVLLVALNGPVGLSLLIPLMYILVAMGVAYVSNQWLQVFPNNPLARSIGIGLVIFAVILSCIYGLRSYFVVWPHYNAIHSIFLIHL